MEYRWATCFDKTNPSHSHNLTPASPRYNCHASRKSSRPAGKTRGKVMKGMTMTGVQLRLWTQRGRPKIEVCLDIIKKSLIPMKWGSYEIAFKFIKVWTLMETMCLELEGQFWGEGDKGRWWLRRFGWKKKSFVVEEGRRKFHDEEGESDWVLCVYIWRRPISKWEKRAKVIIGKSGI